jgi:hypothetical protein
MTPMSAVRSGVGVLALLLALLCAAVPAAHAANPAQAISYSLFSTADCSGLPSSGPWGYVGNSTAPPDCRDPQFVPAARYNYYCSADGSTAFKVEYGGTSCDASAMTAFTFKPTGVCVLDAFVSSSGGRPQYAIYTCPSNRGPAPPTEVACMTHSQTQNMEANYFLQLLICTLFVLFSLRASEFSEYLVYSPPVPYFFVYWLDDCVSTVRGREARSVYQRPCIGLATSVQLPLCMLKEQEG